MKRDQTDAVVDQAVAEGLRPSTNIRDGESLIELLRILDQTPVLLALYDPSDMLAYANHAFKTEFGLADGEWLTFSEMMRKGWAKATGTLTHTDDFEKWLVAARSRRGKQPFKSFETDMKSGRWLWMTETVSPEGWFLSIAPDISQLRSFDERSAQLDRDIAVRLSMIDELTGVFNRRGILHSLDVALTNANSIGTRLAIAVLDIDHFKSVNDNYGHDCGDEVITIFARHVQDSIRVKDIFGRFGGEEFLIVFPNISSNEAFSIVERIRKTCSAAECGGTSISFTFSAGITDTSNRIITGRALLKEADARLYVAKRQGRNCTVITDR